jgi:hypothetical protein
VQSTCSTLYPSYGSPRLGAGETGTDDVIKCQLKPFNAADYPNVTFTAAQLTQLQQAFPTGVCDYKQKGVGQAPAVTWQTYQDASGNVIYGGTALPAAPVSAPIGPAAAVPDAAWAPMLVLSGLALAAFALRGRRRTAH